jgi:DNA repair photolyase
MSEQQDLFSPPVERPIRLGQADISYGDATSILTPASGFMATYDYTLNPYGGCAFGCAYCYAAFFTRDKQLQDSWGRWVKVKQNALALIRKIKPGSLAGKWVYMSSVTDPYQPIEKTLKLTRHLLQELATREQPKLVIQTRSPLVTRDIDLLSKFTHVQVNMTVTTDSEDVRKAFEPLCPSNRQRLSAAREVMAAGIDTVITMTPLLPVQDAEAFASQLLETGVRRFIVQPFHAEGGRFVAGTRDDAVEISQRLGWSNERYLATLEVLKRTLPEVGVGKQGFAPRD